MKRRSDDWELTVRKWWIGALPFVISCFVLIPAVLLANNYTQVFQNGRIDWSNGFVEAEGMGSPPIEPLNEAHSRAVAKAEAVAAAQNNLLEIINLLRIDSETLVRDFISESVPCRRKLLALLRNSYVVDVSFMPNGSVRALLVMKTTGPFAELVLPKTIQRIESIQDTSFIGQERLTRDERKVSEAFSGVVIDSRGFQVNPAMAPRILDEEGNEVYGAAYVSREHAVQQGVVGYTKNLKQARINYRVAARPLVIKGVRTIGGGRSDIVVSNADAARVRGTASNLTLLQKCRVVIVID